MTAPRAALHWHVLARNDAPTVRSAPLRSVAFATEADANHARDRIAGVAARSKAAGLRDVDLVLWVETCSCDGDAP